MKLYTYYHNEQKTIFDILVILREKKMVLFFHGTDRVIEYNDLSFEETSNGTRILYGAGSSLPWIDKNGKITEKWEETNVDFVSLDVESASTDHMICQLGICIVANKRIVGRKSWLIQPPSNRYDWQCVKVHNITAEMTQDAPTFDQSWQDIKDYLTDSTIVAHNAANFDEIALRKNLAYYHIDDSQIKPFIDTISIWGRRIALDELCAGYGWSVDGHHDALWDAEKCAMIYLEYLAGNQPNWQLVDERHLSKETKVSKSSSVKKESIERKRIKGDVLVQDLSNAKADNNPFYDRKVVITGEFELERNKIAEILKDLGADVNTSISKKTHYVLVGTTPGPSKMAKISQLKDQGFDIRLLSENDFNRIVKGIDTEDLSEYIMNI